MKLCLGKVQCENIACPADTTTCRATAKTSTDRLKIDKKIQCLDTNKNVLLEDNSSIDNPSGQVIDSQSEISSDSGTAINMPEYFLPPFTPPSGFFPGFFPGFGQFGFASVNGAGHYAALPSNFVGGSSARRSIGYSTVTNYAENENDDDDDDDQ